MTLFKSATRRALLIALLSGLCTLLQAQNHPANTSLAPVLKHVLPSVVNISVLGTRPDTDSQGPNDPYQPSPGKKFHSVGSGVIISEKNGLIITNAHVIQHAKLITVVLNDGRHLRAIKLSADDASDIALLQVHAKHLTAIQMGNSSQLEVGDFVAAIGNPYGLNHSVTSGMVSALHRNDLQIEGYEDFIQTDAPINPGNSGGALINMKGQLVGMNTAIIGPDGANVGIGFAIPSNMIHSVVTQLLKSGKVNRGILGVVVQEATPSLITALHLKNTTGAVVTEVIPGSPAYQQGLRINDVITQANGSRISNPATLRNAVGLVPAGHTMTVEAFRGQHHRRFHIPIASLKQFNNKQEAQANLLHGVKCAAIDEMTTNGERIQGTLVITIDFTSPAWFAGLRPGDVILSVNDKHTPDVAALHQQANTSKDRLVLKVHHQFDRYVVIEKMDA